MGEYAFCCLWQLTIGLSHPSPKGRSLRSQVVLFLLFAAFCCFVIYLKFDLLLLLLIYPDY